VSGIYATSRPLREPERGMRPKGLCPRCGISRSVRHGEPPKLCRTCKTVLSPAERALWEVR